jgi:hypothetical protein
MMKKYVLNSLIVIIFLNFVACSSEKTTTKKIQEVPDHPRIIINQYDVSQLEKGNTDSEYHSKINTAILNVADGMLLLKPLIRELKGRRLLYVSSIYSKRILYLSCSYLITRDNKYLLKAEEEMLAASAFSDWNPSHFLDVAEMITALAIGYDWLYSDLSDESKQKIKQAIIEKGLLPSLAKNHWWLRADNNWNQICNTGLVLGSLAIYEDDPALADTIIERASLTLKLPLEQYEPDGAYPEGPGYWAYGTTFNVILFDAIEKIPKFKNKFEVTTAFMKSAEYVLHTCGPTGNFNYSDCGLKCFFRPVLFWFSEKLHNTEILWHQKEYLDEIINTKNRISVKGNDYRFLPFLTIWGKRLDINTITEPKNKSWTGNGVTPVGIHRTSWDNEAIFIGIKGGSPSNPHAHMDVGSFVMDANNVRWAIDLGAHDYYKLESQGLNIWSDKQNSDRWRVFRYNNFSHNTLTVNNQLQQVEESGSILRSSDSDNFCYTIVDITPVYGKQLEQVIRGISIINNSYVIVRDELINGDQTSRIKWNMLTQKNIQIMDSKKAVIRKDGKSLIFKVISPENVSINTYTTDPDNNFEDKNPKTQMIGFELELKPNQKEEMVVALVPGKVDTLKHFLNKPLNDW